MGHPETIVKIKNKKHDAWMIVYNVINMEKSLFKCMPYRYINIKEQVRSKCMRQNR